MRRRMKRFLAFFCSLVMLLTMAQVNAFAMSNDIDNHWAKNTIQTWMDQDLVSGYPDGTFRPDANITRAEYMALVNNAYSLTQETDISFLDVKASDWYYNIVRRALFAGYIGGYPDNKIRPNQPITRQEAAVIIAKIKGLEENPLRANDLLDGGSIDPWSKGYIGAVLEAGYMAGYPDGTFKAKNPIKRGEAVFALNNTIKDHEESEEITESIDEEDISVPTSPSSSSGGGGGGGGSQTIAVTTITVSGAGGASTITAVDGTLQMSVNVAPAEASNKSVTWSVTPQTGSATISSTGLLTAVANGTITVVATAQDGSGITGSRQIIISGQSTESVSNKAELEAAIDNNSITNIVLISSINDDIAQSTARTSSFTIDFGSHVLTGNLDITANNLSMITFNGDAGTRIDGDITLQATGATVNNNVAITGTATLNGVGFSSYNANRTHSGGIRMIGRGRLNLSGNAGGSDVEIDTADAVVIAGEANNVVIRQPNTSIRSSGSVANIIVDAGATGSRIERLSGSTISSLVANGAVTIAREDDVDIIGDVSGVAAGSVLQPVEYRLTLVADPLAGGTVTGAGSANSRLYTEGTVVDIDASANLGYNFDGWEATTGIFDAAGTANTNFHMPAQAVTVTANFSPIVVTDVEIDQDNHTIKTGTSSQLSATITPGNAVDQTVVWSSSNNEVAIVDNVGEVTGIAVGTAVITVATNDGGYSDTVIITVENREISSVETISEIYVAYATSLGAVEAQLPLTVEVILDDASTEMLTVIWDDGTPVYNGTISGTYVFEGTLILATGISNTASYVATVEVMVDVDKSALLAAIEAGNIKHDAAIEGIEIGEYASGAKVIFKMAIEAAEGVAADGSATQIAVNQAVSDLATAEGIFDGTQVTSIDNRRYRNR
ncbi:MAG: hypothetical protein CVU95_16260 [Firmicutes bacterium HGW-Firmicutes-2]|nr:MAG: hypothetical protein CVU95_16260 [Firmicutes bacterium HGW-Firmicutes-2]